MGLRVTVIAHGRPSYLESMLSFARCSGIRVQFADPWPGRTAASPCDALLWDVAALEELPPDWPQRVAPFGRVPLLVVSHAGPQSSLVARLLRAGVDDVLWLPELNPELLIQALRKAVARARMPFPRPPAHRAAMPQDGQGTPPVSTLPPFPPVEAMAATSGGASGLTGEAAAGGHAAFLGATAEPAAPVAN